MLEPVTMRLLQFLDWLADGLLVIGKALSRRPVFQVHVDRDRAEVTASGGAARGEIKDAGGGKLECHPDHLNKLLDGSGAELVVPYNWVFRHRFDPVSAQSAPFLDAFARHQIGRVTPWRPSEVLYQIFHSPLAGDPGRIGIEIGIIPKRLVMRWITLLRETGARHIRIVAVDPGTSERVIFPLDGDTASSHRRLRNVVAVGLAVGLLSSVATTCWLTRRTYEVMNEISNEDSAIDAHRAALSRARTGAGDEHEGRKRLIDLRRSRPHLAQVIDTLSQALPDSSYLTDLTIVDDHVTVSGVTSEMAELIPALSRSFDNVVATAATTRVESGSGDRFHIEMDIRAAMHRQATP